MSQRKSPHNTWGSPSWDIMMYWTAGCNKCRLLQISGPSDEPCTIQISLSYGVMKLWVNKEVLSREMAILLIPVPRAETIGGEGGAGSHYPWTSFHSTETHALPHSSGLHNWKHLGMKIESRWHINGPVLQGHADKKRLPRLTGHFHDRVTGPP